MCTGNASKSWLLLFFAILWSIWLFRNQVVFNDKRWDTDQVLNIIKVRFGYWFKAHWPNSTLSLSDIIRCHEECFQQSATSIRRVCQQWNLPEVGSLKFNVDGSALGKPGPAGIGGILRDEIGDVKAKFSKNIGVNDSNMAEFLAIREALLIFATSRWNETHRLIIESDSKNAVAWITEMDNAPWRVKNFVNQIKCIQLKIRDWKCQHVMREANNDADILAKAGVNRTQDLMEMYD